MTYERQLSILRKGTREDVAALLERGGFDYLHKPSYMMTPLNTAIHRGDTVILEMLLKAGAPEGHDWFRSGDITLAIQAQDVESVILLLKYGVSCSPDVAFGNFTVLGYAINELEWGDSKHPSEKKQKGEFIVLLLIALGFLNHEQNKLAKLMNAVCTSDRVTAALLSTKCYDNPHHAFYVNKLIRDGLLTYKVSITNAWRKSVSFTTLLLCDSASSSSLQDEDDVSSKRSRNG